MHRGLLEHIGHYADIDTRRAMGLPPRKITVPDLKLKLVPDIYWQNHARTYKLDGAELYIHPEIRVWQFGTGDVRYDRIYEFFNDGHIFFFCGLLRKEFWHPDFNKDGTLRRDKIKSIWDIIKKILYL